MAPTLEEIDLLTARRAEARLAMPETGDIVRRAGIDGVPDIDACVACDRSPAAVRWAASIREQHRRFPAFRAELDRYLGAS